MPGRRASYACAGREPQETSGDDPIAANSDTFAGSVGVATDSGDSDGFPWDDTEARVVTLVDVPVAALRIVSSSGDPVFGGGPYAAYVVAIFLVGPGTWFAEAFAAPGGPCNRSETRTLVAQETLQWTVSDFPGQTDPISGLCELEE